MFIPKNQTPRNTADAAKSDKRGTAEGPLPLSSYVVGLISHESRDVGISPRGGKEHAEVADRAARVPP